MYYLMQVLGILGAVFLLYAYIRISHKSLQVDNILYHSLNLGGAVLLVINTVYFSAYGPMALNIIWAFISGKHIFKMMTAAKTPP